MIRLIARRAALVAALLLALAPTATVLAKTIAAPPRILAIRLEGPVTPVMDEALRTAVRRAERDGDAALLIRIDTPGGLESSMREMVKTLLASEVPTIAWVAPGGARAASAGVFITIACDIAAMAPGTNIGAATPIQMQGAMDSTLARKATNDASAFARTVAAQRGRNGVWAEHAVRAAVSASETEAVELHVVDFIAATEAELLAKADGRTWRRGSETHVLHVRDLPVEHVEPDFRQRLLAGLANPNVAYLLMMLGFYGLIFELQSPGAILPGIVGGISLILAFLALSTMPVNAAGVALIVLGLGFLLAEIKVASHGMLAVGGTVALVLGSLVLFRSEGLQLSPAVIAGVAIVTVLFFLFVIGAGIRAQRAPVRTGAAGLIGAHARVLDRLAPSGHVQRGAEIWNATSSVDVEYGAEVIVVGVEGLTLRVRPAGKEA